MDVLSKPILSATAVTEGIASAVSSAADAGLALTIAVVDDGGNLKAFVRMDGAPLISVRTAQRKAFAAAAIGIPPDAFFDAIQADAGAVASFSSRDELALIGGGVPIRRDGHLIGGIGVAGAMTAAEDRQIADVLAAAISG
jgi:uncharacterized protein GlcG (DUF336 family)